MRNKFLHQLLTLKFLEKSELIIAIAKLNSYNFDTRFNFLIKKNII